jgi:CheY-like chemotaxis protein
MYRVLIADAKTDYQVGIARLLEENGYPTLIATGMQDALEQLRQERIQVVVLGAEFDGRQAADLIPQLKNGNRHLAILLVADDQVPQLARRIRQAGIFYHALYPSRPEDGSEILQAVKCAFASLNQNAQALSGQGRGSSTFPNEKGEHHENAKTASRNDSLSASFVNAGPGGSGGARRSQRPGGLGLSRLLRLNRDRAAGAGNSAFDRDDQGAAPLEEQIAESVSQIIARPVLQLILREVIMTRWIILGGAVILAAGLTALAALVPETFHGFSGIVIWLFLGFCSIIVVAQLLSAFSALLELSKKPFAQKSEQLVKGGKS